MKKLYSLLISVMLCVTQLITVSADSVMPDAAAERWTFFKENYTRMPKGMAVSLIVVIALIVASIIYYKVTIDKTPNGGKKVGR